jgi:hypothetical protein
MCRPAREYEQQIAKKKLLFRQNPPDARTSSRGILMRTVTFGTSVAWLAAGAGLVAAVAVGTTSASASTRPASTGSARTGPARTGPARTGPAATPARWSRVTPNGTLNSADIGLAMTGKGVLNVIWANGISSAGHGAIEDTPVNPAGAVGRAATVLGGQLLVTYPDATVTGNRIDAVWNGIERNPSPDGSFISTRAQAGGRWSAPATVAPLGDFPFTSSSDATTAGADGKPWVAYSGTGSLVVDHFGQAAEHQIAPSACCYYNAGLAVDGHSGQTYVAYNSLISRREGIYVQRLAATGTAAGAHELLPGSVTEGNTLVLNQRVGITGRGHGRSGVYVAYVTGYPFGLRVDLLRLGTRTPLTLARTTIADGFAGATVTANPAGGLWAAWYEGDGSPAGLFVRLSDNAVTRWGKAVRVALPAGTTTVFKVYISAQRSRLDVVALVTAHGKTAYWVTQVR